MLINALKFKSFFRRIRSKENIDTLLYTLGNVVSSFLALITLPLITKLISPDQLGIFNYTSTIKSFLLTISALSLDSFLLRYYFKIKRNEERKNLFGTIFIFLFIFNTILFFIEIFFAPLLVDFFDIKVAFDPYIKLMLLNNYLEIFAIIPLIIFRVNKKPVSYFLITAIKSVLYIVVGIIFIIVYNNQIIGRYIGILLPNILFLAIYFLIIKNNINLSLKFSLLKKGLKYSLPIVPAAFAASALTSIDKVMIERYLDISQLAIYSIGVSLGGVLLIFIRGFYLAIEPVIFEKYENKNFSSIMTKYKNNFVFIITILGSGLIIFSYNIINIFTAPQYYDAVIILPFIVISCIFRGAQIVVNTALYALEKTFYHPIITFIGLAFNIIGNMYLLPWIGIKGAAIVSAISFWLLYQLSVFSTKKYIKINWMSFQTTLLILSISFLSIIISSLSHSIFFFEIILKTIMFLMIGSTHFLILKKLKFL